MKKHLVFAGIIFLSVALFSGCCVMKGSKKSSENGVVSLPSPQAIIYKTRGDYAKLVPVELTPDKKSLASYPDIKDLTFQGNLSYPVQLNKGYLLDNRGISQNVAFLKLSYEEYIALPKTPSPDELMGMILDKNPIRRMYFCGPRNKFQNLEEELNAAIDNGNLKKFNRIR